MASGGQDGSARAGKARARSGARANAPVAKGRSGRDTPSSSDEGEDMLARTSLDLSKHPMPPLDGLTKTIAQFAQLQRLDISSMAASEEAGNPHGLTSLAWLGKATRKKRGGEGEDVAAFGDKLSWLKMTENEGLGLHGGAEVWNGIERLTHLTVLNASSCALGTAPPASALLKMSSLGALILAHNSITTLGYVPHLAHLNTLVLSHNKISSLPVDLPANVPSLKKLSITQNALAWKDGKSPLPDFTPCSHLREIRLTGNSKLGKLPAHMATWGRGEGRDKMGTGLETLEVADCGLNDWASIDAVLQMGNSDEPPRRRRGLGNLSIKGNAVTNKPGYRDRILAVHPTLRTLDGEKIAKEKEPVVGNEMDANLVGDEGQAPAVKGKVQGGKKAPDATQSLKKTSMGETSSAAEALQDAKLRKSAAQDAKLRKRGKRGSKKGDAGVPPSTGVQATNEKRVERREESAVRDSRASARAGSPPPKASTANATGPPPSKRRDTSKRPKAAQDGPGAAPISAPRKKRKAWDQGEDEGREGGGEKDAKRPRAESPKATARNDKAQTSVAAVIQLGKKKPDGKGNVPIWGHFGRTADAGLGGASAWE